MIPRERCPRCERWGVLVGTDGHHICEDCYGRLSKLERTPATMWNVLAGATVVLGRLALPAAALVAIGTLPLVLFRHAVWEAPPILDWALAVLLQGVMLHMAQRAIREQPLAIERSVRAGWDAFFRLLRVSFFVHLQVGAILLAFAIVSFTIALAIPDPLLGAVVVLLVLTIGVIAAAWRASSLAVALPLELHESPSGSALRASTNRMKKRRPAALMFAVCGIVATLVPLVSYSALFVLGMLASLDRRFDVAPWADSTIAAQLAAGLSAGALGMLTTAVSAVLYAKTSSYRIY